MVLPAAVYEAYVDRGESENHQRAEGEPGGRPAERPTRSGRPVSPLSALGGLLPVGRLRHCVADPPPLPNEVSESTYQRWRSQYGGMKAAEAKRLKELEDENRRLKTGEPFPEARVGPRAANAVHGLRAKGLPSDGSAA